VTMENLSKLLKIALVALLLCVGATALGCGGEPEEAALPMASVQRGDLSVEIAASGNLALSVVEDLAFEISGTVDEILVEEGDSVEEGQLLVKLDTSEWEKEITNLELALIQAEINLENAELALEQAEGDTTTTATGDIATQTTDPKEIEILELRVELAEASYEDAESALEEARAASPEITAPFEGFITSVNIEGGDEVLKGTVAVTLADPDKFEADILVSELDIVDIALGGTAWVEVEALGVTLPAEVVHISPTSTIQSGVVNYTVKVELQSIETMMAEQPTDQPETDGTQGPPEGFSPPDDFEMPEGFTPPEDFTPPEGQLTATTAEDVQLREGMTVTVSIIIEERNDVLLVPNGAIITQGGQAYVQVLLSDGTVEDRAITVGISDWQYTEVTEGLSEGELVVIPEGTATTTTTEQQGGFPDGGMVIPGMGGMGGPQ
jgi:RND family efflux transporter MFP subunit